jgi:dolichyl-phosphate beta-glucosyltransferase
MITIIIPAYNEENRILNSLNKIVNYFKDDYEIIVVDDGSTDDTRKLVEEFDNVIINEKRRNMGKGYSIRQGVSMASGELILITDADLSTPITDYEKLNNYIDDYPIVIGSRSLDDSIVENKFFRVFLGKLGNIIIRLIVKDINDTQCGFKLFKSSVAKLLFKKQKINGFGFDFEILLIAQKNKYKIREIPITYKHCEGSKVRAVDYLITLYELFKIVIYNLNGQYR